MKRDFRLAGLFFQVLILVLLGLLCPGPSHATPPEAVQIKYNLNTHTLLVTIKHDTMLKGSHYIKFVEIKKNGSVFSINTYDSQPTGETFTYSYNIPAIEEDTFSVKATCNMYGSKTSSLLTVTP